MPLLAHGHLYGVLLAVRQGQAFSDRGTAVTHYAARLAAVHLGHSRQHDAVRDTVLSLQRALLSEPGRPHPNLDLATRYLPSGSSVLVGGDWFETVRLHFGRTLLVVGDVMGHGLDAAVDMNAYRSMLRYVASTDLPPHRVLRRLDAAVAEDGARRPATCLLVQVDPARGSATLASAGHLPPVVFAGDGTGELLHLTVGPPLGTGVGGYEAVTRALAVEDTLVMFTDGLVERRGEDIDASLARLAGLRLPPGTGVDAARRGPRRARRPARGGRRGAAGSPHPPPTPGLRPDAAVTDVRLPPSAPLCLPGDPFRRAGRELLHAEAVDRGGAVGRAAARRVRGSRVGAGAVAAGSRVAHGRSVTGHDHPPAPRRLTHGSHHS